MQIEIPAKDPVLRRATRYPEYRKAYSKLPEYVETILRAHHIKAKKAIFWKKGISSFVFKIVGKRDLALKISPRYGLYRELYFFNKAQRAGFPTPKIIVADLSRTLIPYDFHIAKWVKGKAPDELQDKDLYDCGYKLGGIFARLHAIRTNNFGFPKPNGKWSHRSWTNALKDFIYREVPREEIQGLFGKKIADLTRAVIFDRKMDIKEPVLVHGDMGEDQFVVDKIRGKWIIRGILDPSDYLSGDPMLDIAGAMITWNRKAYREGFHDGYVSSHPLSEREQYRLDRLSFLDQVWAASITYQTNKKDGMKMAEGAIQLAKKFDFLYV